MSKRVYPFWAGKSEGRREMKMLLGNKGAFLCEMAHMGLNVPPGFVITTEMCTEYHACGGKLPPGLMNDVKAAVAQVEVQTGRKFGDPKDPLLLSVRSGAAVSMPGMMDTVLNLGLNDAVLEGLAAKYNRGFALDCYRRLLAMFGDVVLHIPKEDFESKLTALKKARGFKFDLQLTEDDMAQLITEFHEVYKLQGEKLPEDPWEQLRIGIEAVFESWDTPRAIKYREVTKVDKRIKGTAVNVQAMVYGNINDISGTGVLFTRNPATGAGKEIFGEYLVHAQGEDVVAGVRTPMPLRQMEPAIYNELASVVRRMEKHMKDMLDVEFTVQDGTLFILQCRSGKRTGHAALQIACDLFNEGMVTRNEAIMMVEPRHLDQLLHPMFAEVEGKKYKEAVVAKGLAASPGAAVGVLVFTAADAESWARQGKAVVLVRQETSPEDIGGMHAAQGIVTARGGMTSHAAVVARGWGKPCVCGCSDLEVNEAAKTVVVKRIGTEGGAVHGGSLMLHEGDWVSLNGGTGELLVGVQETKEPELEGNLGTLMAWVDSVRRLKVFANADSPEDALVARKNGAEGLGLCRTEHCFFVTPERIAAVRRMIAAEELKSPQAYEALTALHAYQREDFEGIFRAMSGLPVTIRLLDPPLHEFLPHEGPALNQLCTQLAKELHTTDLIVKSRLEALHESNPMLGLRGCRLGIIHPEISKMQATAIFEAATAIVKEGHKVYPHIMVPLVSAILELNDQVAVIKEAALAVATDTGTIVPYEVGCMIEVPRSALMADQLAQTASFFSFGTNDLTQMTMGFSRDDAQANFLTYYLNNGLLLADPFETLDVEGVGQLVRMAVERGRATRPDLELGVCGEHGGDPPSIDFFSRIGLDYVSCSPHRVPVARLAAAQATIKEKLGA